MTISRKIDKAKRRGYCLAMPRQFPALPAPRLAASPTRQTLIDQSPGKTGVRETLAIMAGLKHAYKTDPAVRELALSLVAGLPQKDYRGEITACWQFVKYRIRYVRDVAGIETVQTPVKTLEYGAGDCDDKSTLLAAMLESIGHPCRFKAVGVDRDVLCHVYPEVYTGKKWLALDTTEPEAMGWEPANIKTIMLDSDDGRAAGNVPALDGLSGGFLSKMDDFSHNMLKRHIEDVKHPFDFKGHLETTAESIRANPAIAKIMKIKGLSWLLTAVSWVFPPLGAVMTYINTAMTVANAALALDGAINKAEKSGSPVLPNGMTVLEAKRLRKVYMDRAEQAYDTAARLVDIDKVIDLSLYSGITTLSAGAYYLYRRGL